MLLPRRASGGCGRLRRSQLFKSEVRTLEHGALVEHCTTPLHRTNLYIRSFLAPGLARLLPPSLL